MCYTSPISSGQMVPWCWPLLGPAHCLLCPRAGLVACFDFVSSSPWASPPAQGYIPASVTSMQLSWRWLPFQGTGGGAGPEGWKASQLPYSCHGNNCLSLGNSAILLPKALARPGQQKKQGLTLMEPLLWRRRKHRREERSLSSALHDSCSHPCQAKQPHSRNSVDSVPIRHREDLWSGQVDAEHLTHCYS